MGKLNDRNKAFMFILSSVLVFFIIAVSGCSKNPSNGILVNYSVDVNVVDDNGNNIHDQTDIYDISGVLSNKSPGYSKGYGAGITINGSSHSNGSVWPVYPGSYMVFGASTNNSLLNDDWENKRFNPGNAGYWTILTYDDITKNTNSRQNVTINVTIVVSNKTGKMIKR